jgi:hypothetical protein
LTPLLQDKKNLKSANLLTTNIANFISRDHSEEDTAMKSSCTIVSCFLITFFTACASTASVTVIQRADHLTATPEWASLTNGDTEEKGKSYWIGYVEVGSDASKSAALNMADQKAYARPMEAMVDAYFQQNKIAEDLRKDSAISELILSAARSQRPPMPGLRVSKRYWELVEVRSSKGIEQQLHVFSRVEIPTEEYEQAKKAVLAKLNGNPDLKKALDDVAKRQQDQLLPPTK